MKGVFMETVTKMATEAFGWLSSFYQDHRFISYIILAALAYLLYLTVRAVIRAPHSLFYLIYGIASGMAVVWFGAGPSGLDAIRSEEQLVVGLTFGAIVGLCIGLPLTLASENSSFFWPSILAIPLAVLTTCVSGIFIIAAIMMFQENPIAATLIFAFFGAIVAPVDYFLLIIVSRR